MTETPPQLLEQLTLGERIMVMRRRRNMTASQLGARLMMSRRAVSQWETDAARPHDRTMIALADALEVDLQALDAELAGRVDIGSSSREAVAS